MNTFYLPFLIMLLSLVPVAVQTAGAAVPTKLPRLNIQFEEVKASQFPVIELFVSIADEKGRSAAALEKRNFTLLENSVPVKKFELTMDKTPLSVVLLLDRSGSMFQSMMHVKMAARKFISLLESEDEVMLIDFSDEPKILCSFTSDKKKLNACLMTLKSYGPTALYDSVYRSILELSSHKRGRPVVVALTDGTDQNKEKTARLSRHTIKEVVERAVADKIPVNTIGLGKFVSKKELTYLAQKTNGTFYYAPTSYQLEDLYTVIGRNLKNRVRVIYKSPVVQWNGLWRKVELKCTMSGAPVGESLVQYRSPGKYVLEVEGQGWARFQEEELSKKLPTFKLRDLYLKTVIEGQPEQMNKWLTEYFKRP